MAASPSTNSRPIFFAIALAVLLVLGYVVFWWIAAGRFEAAVLAWIEARRADGYTIRHGAMERSGFPAALRLTVRDPAIESPGGDQGWSWSASFMVAEIAPWSPLEITLRTEGPQALVLPVAAGPVAYEGSVGNLTASIASDHSLSLRALTIRELVMTGRDGADVLAAGGLDIDLRQGSGGAVRGVDLAYELTARATDLRFPARLRLPLGELVSRVELDADVMGDVHSHPWPDALQRWRDSGGVVEISELDVLYGPLRLTLEGTVALDGNGQPMGAFVARGQGLPETLDVLYQRGLLPGPGVASAKLALRVLSRGSQTGEPGVSVPLTLQDRILSAASFPVVEVPAIRWGPGTSGRP
jgi:hypothetical protein